MLEHWPRRLVVDGCPRYDDAMWCDGPWTDEQWKAEPFEGSDFWG